MNFNRPELEWLVYDFDGVIIDTMPIKDEEYRKLWAFAGPERQQAIFDFYRASHGIPRKVTMTRIIEEFLHRSPEPGEVETLATRYSQNLQQRLDELKPIRGITAFLKSSAHLNQAIVSSAPEQDVDFFLERFDLGSWFCDVRAGTDLKSEALKRFIADHGISQPRKQMIYLGDKPSDQQAAAHAGCRFIGINGHEFSDPCEHYPDFEGLLNHVPPFDRGTR